MGERVRLLNEEGTSLFRDYLGRVRGGATDTPPTNLLIDPSTSHPFDSELVINRGPFSSREEFGEKLSNWLSAAERRVISREAGLWNWLALFYFDDLAPPTADGHRRLLAIPHYLLEGRFAHNRYYRHLVRFAWLSVTEHGTSSRILLASAGKASAGVGQWGDISEQLGAYQGVFGSRTAVRAANGLFIDPSKGVVRGAASGSGPGSVRRFSQVLKQFTLTYDLRTAAAEDVIALLPKEFDRFRREYEKRRGKSVVGDAPPAISNMA